MTSKYLYTWGRNPYGQMGFGDDDHRTRITYVGEYAKVATGTPVCHVIDSDGKMYGAGWNLYGSVGNGVTHWDDYQHSFVQIATNKVWASLHSHGFSSWHTLAVDDDGDTFGWGLNNYGQLGLDDETDRDVPTGPLSSPSKLYSISIGASWSAGIYDGDLYTWGRGANYRTGLDSADSEDKPVLCLENVSHVGCNSDGGHAITTDGKLWGWGRNNFGQVGDGDGDVDNVVETPKQIGASTDWEKVAGGQYHAAGICDGKLYAWGRNNEGQLGQGNTTNTDEPTQVGSATNWVDVACGTETLIALNILGQIWVCGSNSNGQLGLGHTDDVRSLTQLPGGDWVEVHAASNYFMAFSSEKLSPYPPEDLETDGDTNPDDLEHLEPEFTAVYLDPDEDEEATHIYIQVGTNVATSDKWDSGWIALVSNVNVGDRCETVEYDGSALDWETKYYWRCRFRNSDVEDGEWSTEIATFETGVAPNEPPGPPTNLETEGQTNPTGITNLTPEFTAIYNDPDEGDEATHIYIQVGTTSGGSNMWDSGWLSIHQVPEGERSNPELLLNTGFEDFTGTADDGNTDDFDHWVEYGTGSGDIVEAVTDARSGDYACKITYGNNGCGASQTITVLPERLYRLELYSKGDGSVVGRYMVRDITNSVNIIDAIPAGTVGSTDYEQTAVYFWTPENCVSVGIYLISPTSSGFGIFDDISLRPYIRYDGTALSLNGTQYHWRCRFRDLEGDDGDWSTETATFTMADTITKLFSESISLSDSLPRRNRSTRLFSESQNISDVKMFRGILSVIFADNLNITDTSLQRKYSFRPFSDNIGIIDGAFRRGIITHVFSEGVSIGDILNRKLQSVRSFAESLSLGDLLEQSYITYLVKVFAESLSLQDVLHRKARSARSFSESISFLDSALRKGALFLESAESLGLSETKIFFLNMLRVINESLSLTELLDRIPILGYPVKVAVNSIATVLTSVLSSPQIYIDLSSVWTTEESTSSSVKTSDEKDSKPTTRDDKESRIL